MSKTYLMRWPDGTHAICIADNPRQAQLLADEESDPGIVSVFECVKENGEFYFPVMDDEEAVKPGGKPMIGVPNNVGKLRPKILNSGGKRVWENQLREMRELDEYFDECDSAKKPATSWTRWSRSA